MSGEAGNPHMGLEIGRSLRLAREKRGLSLQQVEEATKIRTRYLRDLENENFDVLPAVYVLGSLKTYAEHLGLDGAAMTRELKRRQASLQAEQDQPRESPPSSESSGFLAALGRLVGITETVEDEAGRMAPVHRSGLYVSLAVVLVFVLATYLASSISGEDQPSVSLVQEPTVSQLPSEIALAGNVEGDERNTEDVNKETQPEKLAETLAKDDKVKEEQSGQEKYPPRTAQMSSSSATAFASVSPASTGSVSAPATATLPQTRVRPEPAASEQPGDAGRDMTAAPTDSPSARAPGGQDLLPSFQRKQAAPADATRLGNRIRNKADNAVDSAW
jgi:transcriptional regulator with XRE-family HTH domain